MDVYIRYKSVYASSKEYAEKLAEILTDQGITAKAFDADVPVPIDDCPVVVFSYVHGPSIPAVKVASEIIEESADGRKVAAVAVGMTPLEDARRKDQLKSLAPECCARFYVPGRLFYSNVQANHKAILTSIVTALKLKPRKSETEKALIAGYNKDLDTMDFAELDQIVEWIKA